MAAKTNPATILHIAGTGMDRLFLYDGSDAVWPVPDAGTLAMLERLSVLCGGRLAALPTRDASACRNSAITVMAHGSVVALEPAAVEAARLYAHLTGRAFTGLFDGDATEADVAVGRFAAWSTAIMRWATRPGRTGRQPGLILAGDAAGLVRQAILRSAARALMQGVRPALRRLVVACDVKAGAIHDGGDGLFGGEAEGEELSQALAGRTDILSLAIHSDGVDAKLSANRTLCSILSGDADDRGSGHLRCRHTGICYRAGMPVETAISAGRLVPHDRLAAPVMVFDACSVLPTRSHLVPIGQSLGARVIEDCASAAVLLNAEVFTADLRRTVGLSVALAGGLPIGEAAADFNAPAVDRATRRLVLIGDPDIRFAARPRESACRTAPPFQSIPSARPTIASDAAFCRILRSAYAGIAGEGEGEGSRGTEWLRAIDAAEASVSQAGYGTAGRDGRAFETAADRQIERVLAHPTSFLPGLWLPQAILTDADDAVACTACGTAMSVTAARFPAGATGRLFAICPHCAAFLDVPASASLDFRARSGGGFSLSADWRALPAKAVLFAHAPYAEGRRQWLWPLGADGRLAETFAPPDAPDAPAWMTGILVSWGLQAASALIPASGTTVSPP